MRCRGRCCAGRGGEVGYLMGAGFSPALEFLYLHGAVGHRRKRTVGWAKLAAPQFSILADFIAFGGPYRAGPYRAMMTGW
jgi:hypothetical protein